MGDISCPYSEHHKKGLNQWKTCKINNDQGCGYIYMCPTYQLVKHTAGALNCPLRKKKEKNNE